MTTKRHFTPLEILNRAGAYGIDVALDGENLVVETPGDVEESTKHKALEVIKANRQAIIAYLRTIPVPPLCYTCLDEDKETLALPDDHFGLMYCEDHHPAKRGDQG